ncbi:MAG: tRNA pseudouridine(38-40) synthase TruA [Phycisphaerales bacterium]|nr:tRNA pseudouridine(38-40) synthase TruA [Phycisphaerales bacterium]
MRRFKLLVAYDGTDFHGWQRQEPPDGKPLRTVQGVMEQAVATVVGRRVSVMGASRTDAGVHAIGQVAAFTAECRIPLERLHRAITARLPADVEVVRATEAHPHFDPISDALSKCYRYSIRHSYEHGHRSPVFERNRVFACVHSLDTARMAEAAAQFVGTHDFRGLCHLPHLRESTVRSVHSCTVAEDGTGLIHIDIAGSGFLYNMVRIMCGTLLDVGRGRREPAIVSEVIASGDRTKAGPTLAPHGLCLRWVHYRPSPLLETQ